MISPIHEPVELSPEEWEFSKSLLEEAGLTEDEAEMALEDFEMGY